MTKVNGAIAYPGLILRDGDRIEWVAAMLFHGIESTDA